MKKLSILTILCLALLFTPKAFGWQIHWWNLDMMQMLDNNGLPIAPGGLVQLIADGGKDGVDDPMAWIAGQADPAAALAAWLAGGCAPVDDDYLVVQASILDFGDPGNYDAYGYFGDYYDRTSPLFGSGVGMYTRFFTAEIPVECDWYGTVGTEQFTPGGTVLPIQLYQLDGENFSTYPVSGGIALTHIEGPVIPEPATMLLGGIGLLLAFFRRKK